jgi:signal transduction histidine kinase
MDATASRPPNQHYSKLHFIPEFADDGNGMTEKEFLDFWMVIGTRSKVRKAISRKFKRKVSGSKGIGRFAVRFLGAHLHLSTTAVDSGNKYRIEANFDWNKVDTSHALSEIEIKYNVYKVTSATATGTSLTISKLRPGVLQANRSEIQTQTLTLTSPLSGLEKPPFAEATESDPGFNVQFSDVQDDGSIQAESVAAAVLDNYVARARLELLNDGKLDVRIYFDRNTKPIYSKKIDLKQHYTNFKIDTPFFVDIRYFPQRKGTFAGMGVNGWTAKDWLKKNCGISIIDNGFRVLPYGTGTDDWLKLNFDKARNVRNQWESKVMRNLHPMPPDANKNPLNNPMLYLPNSGQVFGAVFVASKPSINKGDTDADLIPSMDRQGYVNNTAFKRVRYITRLGLELIAYHDHMRVREAEEADVANKLKGAEEDLTAALHEIQNSPSISIAEKKRLGILLSVAATNYSEVDTYRKTAQESLEMMSLLGVLAGFMTHEFEQTLFKLSEAIRILKKLTKFHSELGESTTELEQSRRHLESYLDYSRLFTEKVSDHASSKFHVKPQIQLVIDTLAAVREKHGIEVDLQIANDAMGPEVPIAAYSGVLLNLLSNSFKAIIARADKMPRKVRIVASSDKNKHRLIVADSGIGIPNRLRERIWEPLFTTTKRDASPIGSGMGLGLALVKRVVENMGGKISLLEIPPDGFVTAFEVEIPLN